MWKPVWKDINILKLKEIFFNKLGVPIDGDFKFGVLLYIATCFCSFPWRWYRQSISKCFFVKSQCQSPFPLSLESWHLLKVDREYFILIRVFSSFMFKSVNLSIFQKITWRKLWHSYISKLFLTKMQVKFSIFFHRGSLNVIVDKFRFVRSKLKYR
jgi:hypothetical protein